MSGDVSLDDVTNNELNYLTFDILSVDSFGKTTTFDKLCTQTWVNLEVASNNTTSFQDAVMA